MKVCNSDYVRATNLVCIVGDCFASFCYVPIFLEAYIQTSHVSFEFSINYFNVVAAPAAMLVSAVIKYAIWPRILKDRGSAGTVRLRHWSVLMRHNANVIFVMLEVGLLGGLPVRLSEMAFAPLYGLCYVLFSWWMVNKWSSPENGAQFIYFFMDTTLGVTTSIALLVLLFVLLGFYLLFFFLETFIGGATSSSSLFVHLAGFLLTSSLVCRFGD